MERDFFMTPEQAKDWGLVDLIVEKNPHFGAQQAEQEKEKAPSKAKA